MALDFSVDKAIPLDLSTVREALRVYEGQVDWMVLQADDHVISSEETCREAVEMASQATRLLKTIETVRKDKTADAQLFVKSVNHLSKIYTDKLDRITIILKGRISAYLSKMKLAALEQERLAQDEARKLQQRLDAESAEKGLPRVDVPLPVMPPKQPPMRTVEGSASQRKDWRWKVVDMELVPRKYLVVDTVAINKSIRAGERNIPGLEIFQEESVQIRL